MEKYSLMVVPKTGGQWRRSGTWMSVYVFKASAVDNDSRSAGDARLERGCVLVGRMDSDPLVSANARRRSDAVVADPTDAPETLGQRIVTFRVRGDRQKRASGSHDRACARRYQARATRVPGTGLASGPFHSTRTRLNSNQNHHWKIKRLHSFLYGSTEGYTPLLQHRIGDRQVANPVRAHVDTDHLPLQHHPLSLQHHTHVRGRPALAVFQATARAHVDGDVAPNHCLLLQPHVQLWTTSEAREEA